MERITGFPPVWDKRTHLLILGSMPSARSLGASMYYGHPQNAFWPIMARLLNFPANTPYAERLARMNARGIGLWDVIQSCEREGSSDSKINLERPNSLLRCMDECPALRCIGFNGKSAEKFFHRHFNAAAFAPVQFLSLPSTSPAYASLSREQKYEVWRESLSRYLLK